MRLSNVKKYITDVVKTDKSGDRLVKLFFSITIGLILGRIIYLMIIWSMITSK